VELGRAPPPLLAAAFAIALLPVPAARKESTQRNATQSFPCKTRKGILKQSNQTAQGSGGLRAVGKARRKKKMQLPTPICYRSTKPPRPPALPPRPSPPRLAASSAPGPGTAARRLGLPRPPPVASAMRRRGGGGRRSAAPTPTGAAAGGGEAAAPDSQEKVMLSWRLSCPPPFFSLSALNLEFVPLECSMPLPPACSFRIATIPLHW
jgi:hypothetical protein